MLRNTTLAFLCTIFTYCASAQIQAAKFLGTNSKEYKLGIGGFLKFAYPIMQNADLTIEGGAMFFLEKNSDFLVADIPVKLGYRYLLSSSGYGFYIEPQAGYNFIGVNNEDEKFTGLVAGGGLGYLFKPGGGIQFNLGLVYEKAFNTGSGSFQYAGLRLTHNFTFKRRDSE